MEGKWHRFTAPDYIVTWWRKTVKIIGETHSKMWPNLLEARMCGNYPNLGFVSLLIEGRGTMLSIGIPKENAVQSPASLWVDNSPRGPFFIKYPKRKDELVIYIKLDRSVRLYAE
jgi:hypothetical protein